MQIQKKRFWEANIIDVAVGTTGPMGGDSGHGGRTYIEIHDQGSTDISCDWDAEEKRLEIRLGGDSEMETITQAFEFIASTLRGQLNNAE